MAAYKLIATGNLLVCVVIAIMCIVHIGSESARRFLPVWVAYTAVLVGAGASGLQPLWWGEWPTPGNLVLSVTVLVMLVLNTSRKFHSRIGD